MTGRLSSFAAVLAVAVASPMTVGAGLVLYETLAPAENSLVTAIMERFGEGESAQADAAREAEAHYQYRLTQAQEENKRLTAAYSRLYDSMGSALQRSFDLEAEVIRMQARNVDETQWAKKVGTNVTDIACMLSELSGGGSYSEACLASRRMRNDIAREYQDILPDARPNLVADMMRDFPQPREFLQNEFDRAADEFGSEGGAQ